MPRVLASTLPFVDSTPDPDESDGLLSRTFLRGFAAGQSLSSHEFTTLLPALLDDFVRANDGEPGARAFADAFARFARGRAARIAVDVGYLAEGEGI